jgi:hypothetical protein
MKTKHKVSIGIVAAFLLFIFARAFNGCDNSDAPKEITFEYFADKLLAQHYISKVLIVNNDHAEIYLTEEALKMPEFKESYRTPGPNFIIKIVSMDSFMQMLTDAQKNFNDNDKVYPEIVTRAEFARFFLSWIAPFIVITIVVGIFITLVVLLIIRLTK